MGTQKEAIKMAIKDEILGHFRRMNAMPGDTISEHWLYNDFLPSLSAKEEAALEEILNEMITEGLITYGPRASYALTQKGKEIMC